MKAEELTDEDRRSFRGFCRACLPTLGEAEYTFVILDNYERFKAAWRKSRLSMKGTE